LVGVIDVSGGVFEGPRLKGRVLPGGSDWIAVRCGGVLIQDVRIVLQTEGGQNILMSYRSMRYGPEDVIEKVNGGEDPDPRKYYFRTQPIFEAPNGEHDWLNKLMALGVGRDNGVRASRSRRSSPTTRTRALYGVFP
jgi:uncharacterized protein DUF3237